MCPSHLASFSLHHYWGCERGLYSSPGFASDQMRDLRQSYHLMSVSNSVKWVWLSLMWCSYLYPLFNTELSELSGTPPLEREDLSLQACPSSRNAEGRLGRTNAWESCVKPPLECSSQFHSISNKHFRQWRAALKFFLSVGKVRTVRSSLTLLLLISW